MPDLEYEPIESERAKVRCIKDKRIGGCGRWFDCPAKVRGVVIVPALWCPACFEAKLKAGDERAKRIMEDSR